MNNQLNTALKFFSGFVTITGASLLFSLPTKAEVNPNPSIFSEYPYSRGHLAQATPDNSQSGDTPYTTPTTQPNNTNSNEITPSTQPTQDTTTPTTNPDVQNNSNSDSTNNNGNVNTNDNNGVRALW